MTPTDPDLEAMIRAESNLALAKGAWYAMFLGMASFVPVGAMAFVDPLFIPAALFPILVTALAFTGPAPTPCNAAESVTYLFPAPPMLPAFGPIQLAKGKGYFSQAGNFGHTYHVGFHGNTGAGRRFRCGRQGS